MPRVSLGSLMPKDSLVIRKAVSCKSYEDMHFTYDRFILSQRTAFLGERMMCILLKTVLLIIACQNILKLTSNMLTIRSLLTCTKTHVRQYSKFIAIQTHTVETNI